MSKILVTLATLLVLGASVETVRAKTAVAGLEALANPYSGPIIDMHLHSYTDQDFWGPAPNPATGQLSVASAEEHLQRSMAIMRQ